MSENGENKPRETALAAFEDFNSVCEDVADENPAVKLRTEADAFENLTETLAECYVDGLSSIPAGQFASMVSDVSNSLNKTEAKQQIVSDTQQAKSDNNGRPSLDHYINNNLQEVRIVRTTDHVDLTRYVWDFGDTTLETESGGESRTHFNWVNFRDSIDDAGGPYCTAPRDPLTETHEWRDWIVDLRNERKTEKTNVGPRTNAVEHLQNRVRRSDAFGSLTEATDYQGVYVEVLEDRPDDAEPVDTDDTPQQLPDWRVETVYMPNEWPVNAAEEFGISTQALQNEIDARGHMLNGQGKIASQEYVSGQYVTFWVVNGDFATPSVYQPEGEASDSTGAQALESDKGGKTDDGDIGSIGGN